LKSLRRKRKIRKKENKPIKKIYSRKKKNKRSKRKRTNKSPEGVKSTKLALKCPFAYEYGIDFDLYQECDFCGKFKACGCEYKLNKRKVKLK